MRGLGKVKVNVSSSRTVQGSMSQHEVLTFLFLYRFDSPFYVKSIDIYEGDAAQGEVPRRSARILGPLIAREPRVRFIAWPRVRVWKWKLLRRSSNRGFTIARISICLFISFSLTWDFARPLGRIVVSFPTVINVIQVFVFRYRSFNGMYLISLFCTI